MTTPQPEPTPTDVFAAGADGVHTYRIPSLPWARRGAARLLREIKPLPRS